MIEAMITGFFFLFAMMMGILMFSGEVIFWKAIPGWGLRAHLSRMAALPASLILCPLYVGGLLDEKEAP
jgi:hypothetical protein